MASGLYAITQDKLIVKPPKPEWIHADIRAEVFHHASLDGPQSNLEDDLTAPNRPRLRPASLGGESSGGPSPRPAGSGGRAGLPPAGLHGGPAGRAAAGGRRGRAPAQRRFLGHREEFLPPPERRGHGAAEPGRRSLGRRPGGRRRADCRRAGGRLAATEDRADRSVAAGRGHCHGRADVSVAHPRRHADRLGPGPAQQGVRGEFPLPRRWPGSCNTLPTRAHWRAATDRRSWTSARCRRRAANPEGRGIARPCSGAIGASEAQCRAVCGTPAEPAARLRGSLGKSLTGLPAAL